VDGSANVVATYRYDVFGAIRSQTGSSPNQWLFTGEQRDSDSGLYFLRARYYDPAIGRFLGRDPLGEGNGYSYVLNNPVNTVDPYGLCGLCDWAVDRGEDAKNAAGDYVDRHIQVGQALADAAVGCWNSQLCRTIGVSVGVTLCSMATEGAGVYGCAAAGALILSAEETADCAQGSAGACGNVALNVGVSVASAGLGKMLARPIELQVGENWRFAPFGNPNLRIPHFHRRGIDPVTGDIIPGQGLSGHLPWQFLDKSEGLIGKRFPAVGGSTRWRWW